MRFIFFDIECANCYGGQGKICEFGYVIVDEKFHILNKKNIIINPGPHEKFHLTGRGKRPDIILSHDEETYRSSPEFPNYYDNIKFLLTQKDTLIFGYSIINDLMFLVSTLQRYILPVFDIQVYDVQSFVAHYSVKQKIPYSLEGAFDELFSQEKRAQLHEHSAVDDALMTMLVASKICQNLHRSIQELIDVCMSCTYDTKKAVFKLQAARDRKLRIEQNPARKLFSKYCLDFLKHIDDSEYTGKRVSISSSVLQQTEQVVTAINIMIDKGFHMVRSITKADYFVVADESVIEKYKSLLKDKFQGKYVVLHSIAKDSKPI